VRRFKHLHRAVADALGATGVRVLRNESVRLGRDGATLDLAGVDDLWSRACDPERAFAGLEESSPRLVLAHNPRTVERLGGRRCDLMLSGHTHGGQVDWPGLGRAVPRRRPAACWPVWPNRPRPTSSWTSSPASCSAAPTTSRCCGRTATT